MQFKNNSVPKITIMRNKNKSSQSMKQTCWWDAQTRYRHRWSRLPVPDQEAHSFWRQIGFRASASKSSDRYSWQWHRQRRTGGPLRWRPDDRDEPDKVIDSKTTFSELSCSKEISFQNFVTRNIKSYNRDSNNHLSKKPDGARMFKRILVGVEPIHTKNLLALFVDHKR
jgi:hypothetical protein